MMAVAEVAEVARQVQVVEVEEVEEAEEAEEEASPRHCWCSSAGRVAGAVLADVEAVEGAASLARDLLQQAVVRVAEAAYQVPLGWRSAPPNSLRVLLAWAQEGDTHSGCRYCACASLPRRSRT